MAVGLGVGLNALMARNLGAGDVKKAEDAAAHGIVLTTIHSLAFVLIGLFLTKPFFHMFTQNKAAVSYTHLTIAVKNHPQGGAVFSIRFSK